MVRAGYFPPPIPVCSLATFGFGAGSSIASCVTGNYSVVAGLPITPAAGKQYVRVAGLPWTGRSILEGATPPVENGDMIVCDLLSSPDQYPITMNADGTFVVAVNGNTARQSFASDVSDLSAHALYGQFTTWVNNRIPVQVSGINYPPMVLALPITALDLAAFIQDPEGDAIVFSIAPGSDPIPPGLAFSAGVISGTPTQAVTASMIFRATDITGDYLDVPLQLKVQIQVPSIIGLSQSAAASALGAVGLTLGTVTYVVAGGAAGIVVAQSPDVGAIVDAGSSVSVSASLGIVTQPVLPLAIRLTMISATQAQIAWDGPSGTFYLYLDGQRQPGSYSASPITISGLSHPRRYRVAVSALMPDGSESEMSNQITFTTELRTLYFEVDHRQRDPRRAVNWRWQ